jgi:hypothetical protein
MRHLTLDGEYSFLFETIIARYNGEGIYFFIIAIVIYWRFFVVIIRLLVYRPDSFRSTYFPYCPL